jgi:hypothetical protein
VLDPWEKLCAGDVARGTPSLLMRDTHWRSFASSYLSRRFSSCTTGGHHQHGWYQTILQGKTESANHGHSLDHILCPYDITTKHQWQVAWPLRIHIPWVPQKPTHTRTHLRTSGPASGVPPVSSYTRSSAGETAGLTPCTQAIQSAYQRPSVTSSPESLRP